LLFVHCPSLKCSLGLRFSPHPPGRRLLSGLLVWALFSFSRPPPIFHFGPPPFIFPSPPVIPRISCLRRRHPPPPPHVGGILQAASLLPSPPSMCTLDWTQPFPQLPLSHAALSFQQGLSSFRLHSQCRATLPPHSSSMRFSLLFPFPVVSVFAHTFRLNFQTLIFFLPARSRQPQVRTGVLCLL